MNNPTSKDSMLRYLTNGQNLESGEINPVGSNGYVKIHRSLMDKGYYRDSEYVHLWVHLIMKATYCKREYLFCGKIMHLKPGQFITGRDSLSKETGIHRSKVDRILQCFESEHQIEQQKTNKFRIITITNWDKYQLLEHQNEQQVSIKRASSEHQVSTNNKDKKDKKDKKEYNTPLPEWIDVEAWEGYVEMRKKKRAPMTERAKLLIIRDLDKLRQNGNDPAEVLNQSVERGWTGVFELKNRASVQQKEHWE